MGSIVIDVYSELCARWSRVVAAQIPDSFFHQLWILFMTGQLKSGTVPFIAFTDF